MDLGKEHGSIAPGKKADFIITRPGVSLDFIPYAYTTPYIDSVYISGKRVAGERVTRTNFEFTRYKY